MRNHPRVWGRWRRVVRQFLFVAMVGSLGACSDLTAYERGVADYEPIYCYSTIANVDCYLTPIGTDLRRLVNFYGPPPRAYAED